MQTRRRNLFTTIRTEGAILPPDLLQRIAEGDRDLPGLSPDDYHLVAGERLGEATTRSWNRLVGAWTSFRAAAGSVQPDDPGTTLTRESWLLVLFQELGYGRLQTATAVQLDGRAYPVTHAWGNVPIHLVGLNVELDRRTPGVAGAATQAPHGLVQELLNRSEERLWAFLSNGLTLRILRDNSSLTRQAYVEFDLEAMMDGEVYSDFVLVWLLCHESRVEGERSEECWLERWSTLAAEQGTRALDGLRQGVEEAIIALGSGFLAHSANASLRDALRSGELAKEDYYRELLRLVYRLLFLFVAEDRELLFDPAAEPTACETYERHYSTRRLRRLAERRRGTRHGDLWQIIRLVAEKLGGDEGCPELGLPALGSFLWSAAALPHLAESELANAPLLRAVRALSLLQDRAARRPVDYKNLGSEELGSIYESLLELHPELNVDAAHFALTTAAGHERKTTGSYYTPSSLVNCLLNSTLDPVLDEAASAEDPEKAILDLRVCDPATGSGHFLVAAAHRIAGRLAAVRTREEEPAPEAVHTALRDVISRCLYGVDVNPMAVELCKVSLWMEALEPGKPLSFLDAHFRCGNSLLGATPELLGEGIPDDAFKPIEGDEKKVASELRKRNRQERQGQLSLEDEVVELDAALVHDVAELEAAPDHSLAAVREKERLFEVLEESEEYRRTKLLADAWCAAFVQEKTATGPQITQRVLRRLADDPGEAVEATRREIVRLADEYHFFHWHADFPAVFAGEKHGFDVVLGNPPWEHVELKEKEFFAERRPEIAAARHAAARAKMIEALSDDDPELHALFKAATRHLNAERHFLGSSGRYPLCGRGRINSYAVFTETMRRVVGPAGRAGCVVPSGIATDATTAAFFSDLVESRSLVSLFDFRNHDRLFYDVGHRRFKFCLLTMSGSGTQPTADFVFWAEEPEHLTDPARRFSLGSDDFRLLNPNTLTCPTFRTRRDAELTKSIYRRVPVLLRVGHDSQNLWDLTFSQGLFNMASDSGLFSTDPGPGRLPLYEAKMVHQFTHRFGDYAMQADGSRDTQLPDVPLSLLDDPLYQPTPRYWVDEQEVNRRLGVRWDRGWLLGWRDICRSTDERTLIASVIPRAGAGGIHLMLSPGWSNLALLIGNLNSFVLDFVARQKVGGTHLAFFVMEQLSVLRSSLLDQSAPWSSGTALRQWLTPRVLELTYTGWDLESFAQDLEYDGAPFLWDPERRYLLRCELDAAFFHLYGLARDDVAYIMDTFPIVRRKDEQAHGQYRTKHVILEIYDELDEAIVSGRPYQTRLDPPPADPRVAHRTEAQQMGALKSAAVATHLEES